MSDFSIGRKAIGDGAPCFIIAEVAQAHEGSVRIAHDFIDAIGDTGADAVKFQAHYAEHESTPDEPWRVTPKWGQDASRYEYWQRTSFRIEDWVELRNHAGEKGLEFLLSAFCPEAVNWLDGLVPAWKVASGEITNYTLLDAIRDTNKPVLMSTGLGTDLEINDAVRRLGGPGWVKLMACTSEYPCPPEDVDLDRAVAWRGLSDHSGTIYAGLAAIALGCDVLEVHVKLSEHDSGFDASSSITIEQLKQLVEGIRFIERAKTPVDKDLMAQKLEATRRLFMERHQRKAAQS